MLKLTLLPLVCMVACIAAPVSAATVQMLPPITGITGAAYNTQGALCSNSITGTTVSSWLSSKNDGWYTTTGNADMQWGYATADTGNQSIGFQNMNGTAGLCAAQKLTLTDLDAYSEMTFSFTFTAPLAGNKPTYTWSLWYEASDGSGLVQLGKENKTGVSEDWSVSYAIDGDIYQEFAENSNGKIYMVFGNTGGQNGQGGTITDISLLATTKPVPEPATATLGLFGLAALLMRRKRH